MRWYYLPLRLVEAIAGNLSTVCLLLIIEIDAIDLEIDFVLNGAKSLSATIVERVMYDYDTTALMALDFELLI